MSALALPHLAEYSPAKRIATGMAVLFTIWFHEGFAPALAAVIIITAWRRKDIRGHLWPVIAGFAVAALLTAISGTMGRTMGKTNNPVWYFIYMLTQLVSQLWPLWLSIAMLVFCRLRMDRARFRELWLAASPYLAGTVCTVILALLVREANRVLWAGLLCSVITVLLCFSAMAKGKRPSRGAIVAACAGMAVYAIWLGGLVYWQHRLEKEQRQVFAAAKASAAGSDDVIYADISFDRQPFWLMGIASNDIFTQDFFVSNISNHYRMKNEHPAIMPAALNGIPYEEWPEIPGDNDLRGAWPYVVGDVTGEPGNNLNGYDVLATEVCITVGEPYESFTPINRFYNFVKRKLGFDADHYNVKLYGLPTTINGEKKLVYYREPMPRGIILREVVRIDTIPQQQ